ncbi:MAG: vatH [bacterium]|nr:MAG: vatH [bacterium]KAF0150266.1 MAG: vatH [bacterium]KAF0169746.1 MAG: vatH [bacterium]TXT19395.1 MAG: vatH [bacterium]
MTHTPETHIRKGLSAGHALFYVLCQEEARLERMLAEISAGHYGDDRPLVIWTSAAGFRAGDADPQPITDPLEAVRHVATGQREAFFLMEDLPAWFDSRPDLVRALRDLDKTLAGGGAHVFLSHPQLLLPETLKHQVFPVELGMPTENEIAAYLQGAIAGGVIPAQTEEWLSTCGGAMRGMSLYEIGHLLRRLARDKRLRLDDALPEIIEAKSAVLMKEGCLKYIGECADIAHLGGLDNLKEWVLSRKSLFTRQAMQSGLPLPKGVLFMGVSGCGKSMAAKVIAGTWNLPLVRLDMNLVLSGAFGAPEFAFDRALRVAEQIAPMVLWIDEMENSFGYDVGATGGNTNIFSSFLTWMQEKPDSVFVVATANRIEKLPAEVIRKGRFDQLFFLDLPSDEERKMIFRIHIAAFGLDADVFNLNLLAAATREWSGAEIEQAVKAARIRAFTEGHPFGQNDIIWNTARMVPLSRTMGEQIKALRQWAQTRATPASKKAEA